MAEVVQVAEPSAPRDDAGANPSLPLQFFVGRTKESDQLILDHHYSKRLPAAVRLVGRAESGGQCQAAIYFSNPANRWSEPVLELMRLVRHPECEIPMTKLISFGINSVRKNLPDCDLIVSNADSTHGHHGGVYQAASWNFHEQRSPQRDGFFIFGEFVPRRTCNSRYQTSSKSILTAIFGDFIQEHFDKGKYLYWKALNKNGERKADRLGLKKRPYPKPALTHD